MYGRKIRKGEYEFLGINEYGSTGRLYHVAYGVIRIKDISAAERKLLCETYTLEVPDTGNLEMSAKFESKLATAAFHYFSTDYDTGEDCQSYEAALKALEGLRTKLKSA